jgi:hypothetical protein
MTAVLRKMTKHIQTTVNNKNNTPTQKDLELKHVCSDKLKHAERMINTHGLMVKLH